MLSGLNMYIHHLRLGSEDHFTLKRLNYVYKRYVLVQHPVQYGLHRPPTHDGQDRVRVKQEATKTQEINLWDSVTIESP